jgi:hypothetical protein
MEQVVQNPAPSLQLIESAGQPVQGAATGRRRHLLIAGTGRTGTSFLVRFLTELGLDSRVARSGDADWDEAAQAGLEDVPVSAVEPDLPYVVKQPWAHEMIADILANPHVEVEAAIIPVRPLIDAAASRIVVQRREIYEEAPWMARLSRGWSSWGATRGGVIHSLDPVDQARLLAVGFHGLIERLAQADVPMIFPAFPRVVEDPDYLYGKLRPILPPSLGVEMAREAHRRTADAAKVRIGHELAGDPRWGSVGGVPSPETLDNIALRRELVRLHERLLDAERRSRSLSARLSYAGLRLVEALRGRRRAR